MSVRRFARVRCDGAARWLALSEDGGARRLAGTPLEATTGHERVLTAEEACECIPLAPCEPGKVLGLGYNYKSLVGPRAVYDEPVFFLKSPTSVCGPETRVRYPSFATKVWVEVELGLIIGRQCRDVSVAEAAQCILGYTIGSDITAENIQGRDWHLARSKAMDDFAPVGPLLVQGVDTGDLEMRSEINGQVFQTGRTGDRILNDAEIVSCLSRYLTLEPWDLILTGTPAGALDSIVSPGDVVRHSITGLGELRFEIV